MQRLDLGRNADKNKAPPQHAGCAARSTPGSAMSAIRFGQVCHESDSGHVRPGRRLLRQRRIAAAGGGPLSTVPRRNGARCFATNLDGVFHVFRSRAPHDERARPAMVLASGRDLHLASLFGTARNEHYAHQRPPSLRCARAPRSNSHSVSPPTLSLPAGSRAT